MPRATLLSFQGCKVVRRAAVALLVTGAWLVSPSGPGGAGAIANGQERASDGLIEMAVLPTEDFPVDGQGKASNWEKSEWQTMRVRPGSQHDYATRFKLLYSKSGIYVLFDGDDKRLTATKREDYLDLWTEDVFECFFWTDERYPIYFEYEISPLGYELPILVPNFGGKFLGWRPWMYSGSRKTQKKVSLRGGAADPQATISGWRAEVFIPYELLKPLENVPPKPGTAWRANFYRMDYDAQQRGSWDWARVGDSFHEYQKYGRLKFQAE